MTTKDFIQNVLINEIGQIVTNHPFLSFTLICVGIELLGMCMNGKPKWGSSGKYGKDFKAGIDLMPDKYQNIKQKLYDDLRNGMAHYLSPKSFILGEYKNVNISYDDHLKTHQNIIIVDHLYEDFVIACEKVLEKEFSENDKVNKDFLYVGPLTSP